jgi:restriction system protein
VKESLEERHKRLFNEAIVRDYGPDGHGHDFLLDRDRVLKTFVDRKELNYLHRAFEQGARGVLLSGGRGNGKTELSYGFAATALAYFSGGVGFESALNFAERESVYIKCPIAQRKPYLLIVDDFDALPSYDREWIIEKLITSSNERPPLRLILIFNTIHVPAWFRVIEVPPLDNDQFLRCIRQAGAINALAEFERDRLDVLYRMSTHDPLFLRSIIEALKRGDYAHPRALLQYIRNFQAIGLVDINGQPLTSGSGRDLILGVAQTNDEILRILKRQPELVHRLSPRKFEELVAELLSDMGFEISLTPQTKDGGFDIYAAKKTGLGRFLYLVECKRLTPPHKVGVEVVRSLNGILQHNYANAGAIVTTSFFTSTAAELQRRIEHHMHLHDYITLQKWIKDFPLTRE